MNKKITILLTVIIIMVLGVVLSYITSIKSGQNNVSKTNTQQNNQAVTPTTNNSSMTSSGDTSDAAMNKDLSNIDYQIKSLETDSTNIDQSIGQ